MRVECVEQLKIQGFYHGLRFVCDTENHRRMTHAIHHRFGFFLARRCIALRMKEVVSHKCQVVLGEVPAVVHGGSKQAIGADHIKQRTDDLLLGPERQTGTAVRCFEMFDNRCAIANHLALGGHERGDGG